ncbi:response regulator [Nitrospirales bacterium NOB]|nr:hypothetical protein [Nitrospirota bacterium]MCK6492454.1 response regulator [Nitrospira sp.]MDL1890726.1 response regulator [Nitrospirales bacterium NOB]MEB2339717.1 response regulator [Nitrospirales bacterium]QOJ34070.1 MAG: response regulator [Nitrospira sp.]
MASTIFVVDSSPAVRRMVEQLSPPDDYHLMAFEDGPTALEAARKLSPHLIVADYHLDNITFSGFCKEIGKADNLAETLIVSIMDASARVDESKLRSLGVKAILKKPFQGPQLLDTVKTVLGETAGASTRTTPKTRVWPPASTGADEDAAETSTSPVVSVTQRPRELGKEPSAMPTSAGHPAGPSVRASALTGQTGDALLKSLFDHLVHLTVQQVDRAIGDRLASVVAKEVSGQLAKALRTAVQEEVRALVRDVVREEVVQQTSAHLPELTDASVQRQLPEALQGQQDTVARLIKSEVDRAAADYARRMTGDIVREVAQEPIREAVQRIVPDVAETQIRAEIKRLSSPN